MAAASASLVAPAWSQAARPAPAARGTVTSFTANSLTMRDASGASKTYVVPEDARVLRLTRIDPSAIKPGSFVATANVTQPDGSGRSTEFRVFAPALRGLGEGHGPMAGEAPGTMMTNGTVSAEVVSTPRGREMDITYGAKDGQGVRHVTIPPNVTIREMSLAARNEIKPGVAVEVRAGQSSNGSLIARAILLGEKGRPPAG
ncbi:MAG: hypothetical protein JWQ52_1164 [Phenylobacterium sp.]|jgi:hypothetical protein|nr:hypothetical protein [Phenylobacterium sp.]